MGGLPTYHIRRSKRAKYARLVMRENATLEVVLPQHMSASEADCLVRQEQSWIDRHLQRMKDQHASLMQRQDASLRPDVIHLKAIEHDVMVRYTHVEARCGWQEGEGHVCLSVGQQDMDVAHVLRAWLKQRAKASLPQMLAAIADEMGETYLSVAIRLQKTRWGSCSMARRINLNAKLMLLSAELVRHVMIHELSHLQHMNHSNVFWQRVEDFDPNCCENRMALRACEKHMPAWLTSY